MFDSPTTKQFSCQWHSARQLWLSYAGSGMIRRLLLEADALCYRRYPFKCPMQTGPPGGFSPSHAKGLSA